MSIFTQVKGLRAKKNAFNLSHQIAQTQNLGQIMPCYVHDGILPNSREKLSATSVVRFQALLAPLQHKVDLYSHFWYVPYRIIDKEFPRFISGEMEKKGETYNCPHIRYGYVAQFVHYLGTSHNYFSGSFFSKHSFSIAETVQEFASPSSLLVYLGYPSVNNYAFSEELPFVDNSYKFNTKRLQAYFFILAQNYINENFTWEFGGSDSGFNLTEELFNFALGDFTVNPVLRETYDQLYTYVQTKGGDVSTLPMCFSLAKILLMLSVLSPVAKNFALPHAWKKDYFTSSLPFVQVGSEVTIPLGSGSATAQLNVNDITVNGQNAALVKDTGGNVITEPNDGVRGNIESINGEIDLEALNAGITINELRAANALQRLKEAYARFGTRFQEWLLGFWGQKASDRSQQLPEWLGGYKVPVQISEIEQTSVGDGSAFPTLEGSNTPQGNLAGRGLGVGGKTVYNRHFEEPGVIIGLCFLIPKAVYPTTGIDRFLLQGGNIYDYFTPQMEHLGEQEVLDCELFANYGAFDNYDTKTFGYQSRYAYYKQIQSKFRGQFADVLNFWHLGRDFADTPVLGQDFITMKEDVLRRPFAVQDVDGTPISNCMLWFNYDVKYIAKMSRFGTPALLN